MSFKKILSLVLSLSLILGIFTACSNKLDKETLPSVTETSETETEPSETTPESTEPAHGPNSTAKVTDMPVPSHGQLAVSGTNLVDQNGEVVQLKGMSSYGINMCANFFNADIVQTLAEDWGCTVLRLAMTTKGNSDDYIRDPDKYFNEICEYVNQ